MAAESIAAPFISSCELECNFTNNGGWLLASWQSIVWARSLALRMESVKAGVQSWRLMCFWGGFTCRFRVTHKFRCAFTSVVNVISKLKSAGIDLNDCRWRQRLNANFFFVCFLYSFRQWSILHCSKTKLFHPLVCFLLNSVEMMA